MSTSNEQNRKGREANQVTVEIIRVDGTHETTAVNRVNWLKQIEQLIGANCLDSVDLRDGRIMFVDDQGYRRALPNNTEAGPLPQGLQAWHNAPNQRERGYRQG